MKDHQNLQTLFWFSKKVGLEVSFNKSKMNLICDRNMCVKCEPQPCDIRPCEPRPYEPRPLKPRPCECV